VSPATTETRARIDASRAFWSRILAVDGLQFRDTGWKSFDVSAGLDRN
jgi:hypothetical protein